MVYHDTVTQGEHWQFDRSPSPASAACDPDEFTVLEFSEPEIDKNIINYVKSIGEANKQEVCAKQLRSAEQKVQRIKQAVIAAKEQLLRAEDQHNNLCTAAKEHKTAQVVQQVIANLSHKLQRFAKLVRCLKKKVDELENEKNTRLIQDQDASLLLIKAAALPL